MISPGLGHALIVWLLRNSAGAAVVALLVLLAQWVLGPRISARWRHNLWLLVIVRLVLPPLPAVKVPAIPHLALLRPLIQHFHQPRPAVVVRPAQVRPPVVIRTNAIAIRQIEPLLRISQAPPGETVANVSDLPASVDPFPSENFREGQAPGDTDLVLRPLPRGGARVLPASIPYPGNTAAPPDRRIERTRAIPWVQVFLTAWGAVALVLVLKTVLGTIRVERALRKLRAVREPALVDLVRDCARMLKLPCVPVLLEGPRDSGPALVGFWRPRLLLPACVLDQFTWREVRHVVLHELIHLRRRDILINYLASIALAVHWFNPLVWLAAARMRAERELACDEAVLALAPWREGRAYGSTIVKLLELLSRGAVPAGAMGVMGHGALMHRRIAMIARFDGSRRHWSASAIVLSAAVAGAALAGAVRAQVQPAEQPQEARAADVPSTDVKPGASPDEAGAKQAIRAEARRDEQTPPATDAPPPIRGGGATVATEPPPPAALESAPTAGAPPAPAPAVTPGAVMQGTPGAAPFGGPQPGMFRPGGMGGPMIANQPRMAGAGGFGTAPGAIGQPQTATIEDAAAVKADAKTIEKLQRPMPIQVQGESYEDVLNTLAQKGGFDVLIDNRALGEINLIPQVQMNIREPQPIEQLLHFVLRQVGGDDIGFSVVHGVVVVSSKAALDRHVVTRVYDIRELGNPDDMQQTIEQTVGSNIAVRFVNGRMIVTTSEPNQREVSKLLAMLRQDGPRAEGTGGPAAETRVLQLKNIPAAAVAADPAGLKLGRGVRVEADPRTNEVIITGPNGDVVRSASVVLEGLDSATPANTPAQGQPSQPANR